MVEGVQRLVWRDARADALPGCSVADVGGAVVSRVAEERDLDAAAVAPGELAAGGIGGLMLMVSSVVCVGGADRVGSAERIDRYPAMVKVSRTTLEIGFSSPAMRAGAVPLTA